MLVDSLELGLRKLGIYIDDILGDRLRWQVFLTQNPSAEFLPEIFLASQLAPQPFALVDPLTWIEPEVVRDAQKYGQKP